MDSPTGSSVNITSRQSAKLRSLVITIILLVTAIFLIIASIVRGELRVVQLSQEQSIMLKRICEATVSKC